IVTESRGDIGISSRERSGTIAVLFQHGSKCVLVWRDSQDVAAQREWITGCEYCGQGVIGWHARRNCGTKDEALFRQRIKKWCSRALVSRETHVVGAQAIDRNQN